jgi:hypothetical protein
MDLIYSFFSNKDIAFGLADKQKNDFLEINEMISLLKEYQKNSF